MTTPPITTPAAMTPDDERDALTVLAGVLNAMNLGASDDERRAMARAHLPFVRWVTEALPDPRGAGRPPLEHRLLRAVDERSGELRLSHTHEPIELRTVIAERLNRAAARWGGAQVI